MVYYTNWHQRDAEKLTLQINMFFFIYFPFPPVLFSIFSEIYMHSSPVLSFHRVSDSWKSCLWYHKILISPFPHPYILLIIVMVTSILLFSRTSSFRRIGQTALYSLPHWPVPMPPYTPVGARRVIISLFCFVIVSFWRSKNTCFSQSQ